MERPRCKNCPLIDRPLAPGKGAKGKIMFIGEAPGKTEARKGEPFVGKAGQLLRPVLDQLGLSQGTDYYLSNVVICHPPGNEITDRLINACRSSLIREIQDVQPKKIVTLGATALSTLYGQSLPVTKERGLGRMIEIEGMDPIFLVPTVHPALILRADGMFRDMVEDITKAIVQDFPQPEPTYHRYLAETVEDVKEYLDILEEASRISFDIESTGLDPFLDKVVTLGFGALDSQGDSHNFLIPHYPVDLANDPEVVEIVSEFLKTYPGEVYMHNGKFDLKFLYQWSGHDPLYNRFRVPGFRDTMLMHYCLDERPPGSGAPGHGLKPISGRYDIRHEKFNFDAFFELPPEDRDYDELHQYHMIDLYVTLRAAEDFLEEMEAESPQLVWLLDNILVPLAVAFTEIELYGTLVDAEHLERLHKKLTKELNEALEVLQEAAEEFGLHVPGIEIDLRDRDAVEAVFKAIDDDTVEKLKEDYSFYRQWLKAMSESEKGTDEYKSNRRRMMIRRRRLWTAAEKVGMFREPKEFNPGSHIQVKKLMKELGVVTSSVEKDELRLAMSQQGADEEVRQIGEVIIEYRQLQKFISTYVEGLYNGRDENDRIHTDYIVPGAATGRIAGRDPNLMNIPILYGPAIRESFIAPPGWRFGEADNSQAELRIAAAYSGDEEMARIYEEDGDIHIEVAASMYLKDPEDVVYLERYMAKYVDFGVIYGRGAHSLVTGWEMEHYVRELGGTRWSLKQAEEFIENMMNRFKGLKVWIEERKEAVIRDRYVELPTGRRRRFPLITKKNYYKIQRQAVNTPIQGLASDLCVTSIINLHEALDPTKARILFTVHDSITLEIREDCIEEVARVIFEEMEDNVFLDTPIPFKADLELGDNWGNLEKFDKSRIGR